MNNRSKSRKVIKENQLIQLALNQSESKNQKKEEGTYRSSIEIDRLDPKSTKTNLNKMKCGPKTSESQEGGVGVGAERSKWDRADYVIDGSGKRKREAKSYQTKDSGLAREERVNDDITYVNLNGWIEIGRKEQVRKETASIDRF